MADGAPSAAYDEAFLRRCSWTIPGFGLGDERLTQSPARLVSRRELTHEHVVEILRGGAPDIAQPRWARLAVDAIGATAEDDGLTWQARAQHEALGQFDAHREDGTVARAYRRAARTAENAGIALPALSVGVLDALRERLAQHLRDDRLGRHLAGIQIRAQSHALLRADLRRVTQANDLMDQEHAEAALPTCEAFLTDRAHVELLRRAGLDRRFGCRIAGTVSEAIALIETLGLGAVSPNEISPLAPKGG